MKRFIPKAVLAAGDTTMGKVEGGHQVAYQNDTLLGEKKKTQTKKPHPTNPKKPPTVTVYGTN